MTEQAQMTVEGADTLARTLHDAAGDLDELDAAAQETAQLVRSRAAGRAPKLTGALAQSLTAETDNGAAVVSSDLVYAGVIHWGWAARNISAHPFLVPAATDSTPIWLGFYERDVQSKLNKVRGA